MIENIPILATTSFITILAGLVLVLTGYIQAKKGNYKNHKFLMIYAVILQAAFLVQYVTRFLMGGETPFPGPDTVKNYIYLPILVIHIFTATLSIYFILRHVFEAKSNENPGPVFRGEYRTRHTTFGKKVFLIWMFSFTGGITIFIMLYLIPY